MLPSGWITEKRIDFEYQSYLLLAYLKTVNDSFFESKLYPHLAELISHHKNLLHLRNEKLNLAAKFPKEISGVDLKETKIEFTPLLRDDTMMSEINSIIDYSIPRIETYIDEGNSIFNFAKEKINIYPVGVIPIYVKEGYLFLTCLQSGERKANVFQFNLSLLLNDIADLKPGLLLPGERNSVPVYCNIHTQYVSTFSLSAFDSFENIKSKLIREKPELPNPATFAAESELFFPVNETFLPVAKKLLIQYVSPPVSFKKTTSGSTSE